MQLHSLIAIIVLFWGTTTSAADQRIAIDGGLLDETQVREVWRSTMTTWNAGQRDDAIETARKLASARAQSGWPALYTLSVQAELLSLSSLKNGDVTYAVQWADIAVDLAPVMGRAYRHRAWINYQLDGPWAKSVDDLFKSWHHDRSSKTAKLVAESRVGWLVSRGLWSFIFILNLCLILKLLRSLAVLWRRWLPWLTGRTQTFASFALVVLPWAIGAPLIVQLCWVFLLCTICERKKSQALVVVTMMLSAFLVWFEPYHYRPLTDASYTELWNERLRQTPELRFNLPVQDLDTETFRLAWSGERDKARALLEEAARQGDLSSEAWTLLGILRADEVGLKAAIEAFEAAVELKGGALEALFNKQRAHFALAQHQEAMVAYEDLRSIAADECAEWSDSASSRPPHGFVFPTLPLTNEKLELEQNGPIWRADDVASGAIRELLGVSREDAFRLFLAGIVFSIALTILRRHLVTARACSDCGFLVEWSQLMWRPMLCARCLPYKLSGKQRTTWTWEHFKGVRKERNRLNFGRILGLMFPGVDHAWLGNPWTAAALMIPAAVAWVVLAGGLLWVDMPSRFRLSMTGVEFLPAVGVLAMVYLVSSFLRLQREQ